MDNGKQQEDSKEKEKSFSEISQHVIINEMSWNIKVIRYFNNWKECKQRSLVRVLDNALFYGQIKKKNTEYLM